MQGYWDVPEWGGIKIAAGSFKGQGFPRSQVEFCEFQTDNLGGDTAAPHEATEIQKIF